VVDNGSCEALLGHLLNLQREGAIQYLLLNGQNVGVYNALRMAYQAAPGSKIAMFNDDVLAHPYWLEASLEAYSTFPDVGMVSACPVHTQFRHTNQTKYLAHHPQIHLERGQFIPLAFQRDFYEATGVNPDEGVASAKNVVEQVFKLNEVEALGTSAHFQYLAPKAALLEAYAKPFDARLMVDKDSNSPCREVDSRMDELGYARLTTMGRYTQHMGNCLSSKEAKLIESLGIKVEGEIFKPPSQTWVSMYKLLPFRVGIKMLHNFTGKVIHWSRFSR
jgi:hypothetical protein